VLALLAGGRPRRLARLDLRQPALFALALAMQMVPLGLSLAGWGWARLAAPALYLLSFLPLLWALWANRHLWPMWLVGLGVALNLSVIAANAGRMPADLEALARTGRADLVALVRSERYTRHAPLSARTRLPFLADVLVLPRPYPRPHVFSPGDVLITLGVCLLIVRGLGPPWWQQVARAPQRDST